MWLHIASFLNGKVMSDPDLTCYKTADFTRAVSHNLLGAQNINKNKKHGTELYEPQVEAGHFDAQEVKIFREYFYLLLLRMKYVTHTHHRYEIFLKHESENVPFFKKKKKRYIYIVNLRAKFICWVNKMAPCTIRHVFWSNIYRNRSDILVSQKTFLLHTCMRIESFLRIPVLPALKNFSEKAFL